MERTNIVLVCPPVGRPVTCDPNPLLWATSTLPGKAQGRPRKQGCWEHATLAIAPRSSGSCILLSQREPSGNGDGATRRRVRSPAPAWSRRGTGGRPRGWRSSSPRASRTTRPPTSPLTPPPSRRAPSPGWPPATLSAATVEHQIPALNHGRRPPARATTARAVAQRWPPPRRLAPTGVHPHPPR